MIVWVLGSHASLIKSQDLAGPVDYYEGFETENPVKFLAAKGKYKVNFAGLTEERVRNGKKSFKLDITFLKDGNYNYWAGPILDIPVADGMHLSGHVFLQQVPPNVSVSLGTSYYMPAVAIKTGGQGRGIVHAIAPMGAESTGRWIRQEADLHLVGENLSRKLMKGEVTPGIRFEKWTIQIFCRLAKDARLVLYVDDISVTGEVPEQWEQAARQHLLDWEVEYKARQSIGRQRFQQLITPLHAEAIKIGRTVADEAILDPIPAKPWGDHAAGLLREIQDQADEAVKKADPKQTIPSKAEEYLHDIRDQQLRPLALSIANLRMLAKCKDLCLFFVQNNPISNHKVLPDRAMIDGVLDQAIQMFATPGEYEPAGFVLLPSESTTVTFKIGDLKNADRVISRENLDLRVVKVWYQAGIGVNELDKKLLTPELLLHDDKLVHVDQEQQKNVIRNIDAPRDSAELLPVHIPANTAKQFWLTAHVPENTAPGTYTGSVAVSFDTLPSRKLTIHLEVLPFELEEPHLDFGLYFRSILASGNPDYVSSEAKTPLQLEAEFRNLKAHGVLYPDVYERVSLRSDGTLDVAKLDQYLAIKEHVGLPNNPLYYLGIGTGGINTQEKFHDRVTLCRRFLDYTRSKGITEVYFYGQDEAMGEELKQQRAMWQAIHEMDGKVWVACSTGFFEVVGDLLDLPLVARQSPADVPRVHKLGRKIWNYSKPAAGPRELPYSQRYYLGWWLVRSGMDGNHNYAYQHAAGLGESGGRPWDDFDDAVYRPINYVYPTVDGVVDTLQWEGVREGIDDVRYLTTLRKAVMDAKHSDNPKATALAGEVETWIERVNIADDLQTVRRQMADRIIQLHQLLEKD